MNLFISPHNDDEVLFGAYTLLKEKPLVVIVTDSWIQFNRGDNITADERWQETVDAMQILNCPVLRLGIRDDTIDEEIIRKNLTRFIGFDKVYTPAIQGGNLHHDLIGRVSEEIFGDKCKYYTTYTKTELYTTGSEEVTPRSADDIAKKTLALDCYKTQLRINRPHFDAVRNKTEWYI